MALIRFGETQGRCALPSVRSFPSVKLPALRWRCALLPTPLPVLRPLLTSRSASSSSSDGRRPFRRDARSPQVRVVTFPAQSPDLRLSPLIARASRSRARSPWAETPRIRFLYVDSRFRSPLLSASSSRTDGLRRSPPCGSLGIAAINFPKGLSPPGHAHAGHTRSRYAAVSVGGLPRFCG